MNWISNTSGRPYFCILSFMNKPPNAVQAAGAPGVEQGSQVREHEVCSMLNGKIWRLYRISPRWMFLGWKFSSSWTVKSELFASTDTQALFNPSLLLNQALHSSSQVFCEWGWSNAPSWEHPNIFILTDPPKTATVTSTVELPWRKN